MKGPLIALASTFMGLCSCTSSARLVYQFPSNHTWIENIAVSQNGSLLLTTMNIAEPKGLFTLDPFDGSAPVLVSNDFGSRNSTLGIVETLPGVFYVTSSDFVFTRPPGVVRGTNAIYKVALEGPAKLKPAETELLTTIEEAGVLNGLTKFNDTFLLQADSALGVVFGVSTETGKYSILISDPLMAPLPMNGFIEGINGLKYVAETRTLYFTNSQRNLYCQIGLDFDARPVGNATVIAQLEPEQGVSLQPDDFALDRHGNAFVTTMYGNSIQRISLSGGVEVVAGGLNDTTIAEPTGAAFGRTRWDWHVLYVVTAGGFAYPVETSNGPQSFGAQVVAIDLWDTNKGSWMANSSQ